MSGSIPQGSLSPLYNPEGQQPGMDMGPIIPGLEPEPPPMPDLSHKVDQDQIKTVGKRRSDKIVKEAKERFKACEEREAYCRPIQLEDLKFVEGDSDNNWQWPQSVYQDRTGDQHPCLTINKTRQHCLQIINDQKQNKPAIKISPVGDGASYMSAQVFSGIIRQIEYQSNASDAYDTAAEHQVKVGIGYWRVTTDYVDERSFDQEIFIRRISDVFSVYQDPNIQEVDGSDAEFGFVYYDLDREEFEAKYPKFKDDAGNSILDGVGDEGWGNEDVVRMAEYFRVVSKRDELISFVNDKGQRITALASELAPDIVSHLKMDENTRVRDTERRSVEWFLMTGSRVIEERAWAGKYIPIVRVIGEESVIEGRLDRKGHVRAMKDPQRMYNYWSSSATEQVALQSKTPYIGSVRAFEGHENTWAAANKENLPFLPFNDIDEDNKPILPPQRQQAPVMADAYVQGMTLVSQEIMAVSGQYQSQLGQQGNEVSGKAIGERQRQGDNATYHYIDGMSAGIRFTGKILLDLIPKIYDTPRALRILAEDGTEGSAQINPQADQAATQTQQRSDKIKEVMDAYVFNPNIGRYEAQADVGANYATQRQEAWAAFSQILTQNPTLTAVIGDLLLKAGDFPLADEAAERLKRMVPPQALGGPSPELQAAQQQVEGLTQSLEAALQALANQAADQKVAEQNVGINVFKAETDRLKAIVDAMNPNDTAKVAAALVVEMMQAKGAGPLGIAMAGQQMSPQDPGLDQGPLAQPMGDPRTAVPTGKSEVPAGMEGVELRKAGDGKWYLPDPNRPGKYLQVDVD